MTIDHVGLYASDLEKARTFFEKNFGATANERYTNPQKGFASYFLSFGNGSRLEIMTREGTDGRKALAHFPTEMHTNWQWWHLLKNSTFMNPTVSSRKQS